MEGKIIKSVAKEQYPELHKLCVNLFQQDWQVCYLSDAENMLVMEIVSRMFRDYVNKWLADPERSAIVQKEIAEVLERAKTGEECERILEVESELTEWWGIDFRRVLENTQWLLAGGGRTGY